MRNVEIVNLNLWGRNFILSCRSFHVHSWDLNIICDHWDHSCERVIIVLIVLIGTRSWDFNISDEATVSVCECHMLMLVAA
jgi:hypothetical protein